MGNVTVHHDPVEAHEAHKAAVDLANELHEQSVPRYCEECGHEHAASEPHVGEVHHVAARHESAPHAEPHTEAVDADDEETKQVRAAEHQKAMHAPPHDKALHGSPRTK